MGMSLAQRFNGNSMEVVQYAKDYGVSAAMDKYDVKDTIAMDTFLHTLAPDYVFQYSKPESHEYSGPDAFDKLLQSILRHNSKLESKISELLAENNALKKENAIYKRQVWEKRSPLVSKVLNQCQENN